MFHGETNCWLLSLFNESVELCLLMQLFIISLTSLSSFLLQHFVKIITCNAGARKLCCYVAHFTGTLCCVGCMVSGSLCCGGRLVSEALVVSDGVSGSLCCGGRGSQDHWLCRALHLLSSYFYVTLRLFPHLFNGYYFYHLITNFA